MWVEIELRGESKMFESHIFFSEYVRNVPKNIPAKGFCDPMRFRGSGSSEVGGEYKVMYFPPTLGTPRIGTLKGGIVIPLDR